MGQNIQNLEALQRLAGLVLDRELAQLAEITVRRDAVQTQIADLQVSLGIFLNQNNAGQDVTDLQNDRKWQLWRRQRRADLNVALANLEAEREAVRSTAKTAFGRNDVLEKILQTAKN